MKKALFAVLCAALLSGITGCRQNRNTVTRNTNGAINVVTTIFPAYDFARRIGAERINLFMLLPPGAESHSFEPSPRDIIAIMNSDIFVYIGGESEYWIDRILESMDSASLRTLALLDCVDAVTEELVEGMEHDDDDHDDDDSPDHHDGQAADGRSYDEHIWTSPRNAAAIVRSMTAAFCAADAANAAFYRENAAAYIAALAELDTAFAEVAAAARRNTIVFADRFPFRYFADAYGLTYFAAFPGCSTETEPSAATVAFLIRKIRDENIPVVFHIEFSNERMADAISAETGARKRLLHSVHNITRRDFDSGLGYLDLMRRNVETLREALY